ncbi:hypothetical protein J6590_026084 [Homalodisca vitripennis]|nr:hypothetical protein J6590_026084 [Homalodisca vitripennis]
MLQGTLDFFLTFICHEVSINRTCAVGALLIPGNFISNLYINKGLMKKRVDFNPRKAVLNFFLDKKLTLIFSGSEKKDGNEVYKLVDQLNRALAELREMIRNRDERIKAPLKWLLSKEGPRYLEVFFDEEKLCEDFQWDSELVAQISKARMQTYNLWKKLKRTYKKNFIWFMCGRGVNTPVTVDPE